jgi:hypothetical protein
VPGGLVGPDDHTFVLGRWDGASGCLGVEVAVSLAEFHTSRSMRWMPRRSETGRPGSRANTSRASTHPGCRSPSARTWAGTAAGRKQATWTSWRSRDAAPGDRRSTTHRLALWHARAVSFGGVGIVTVGRSMLVIIWHLLSDPQGALQRPRLGLLRQADQRRTPQAQPHPPTRSLRLQGHHRAHSRSFRA